jgi:Peptidase family M23
MQLRRALPAPAATLVAGTLVAGAVLAGLVAGGTGSPAGADEYFRADQELPFTCGETWTGKTRSTHSPSTLAVDFNRDRDLGRMVMASAAGVVSRVEDAGSRSYGKWVRIEHPDGYSTLYAHLKVQWVVPGQAIDQGDPIGRVGDTGGVTSAHLHYEQRLGSVVKRPLFHGAPYVFGSTSASQNCPDLPVAGDWDGDHVAEVGVFRRTAGTATFALSDPERGTTTSVRFGRPSDLPITGDWDGDGVTDLGVRRQATAAFFLRSSGGTATRVKYGFTKDRPVTGDWDGNGTTDVGIWRPAVTRFRLLMPDGTSRVVRLGTRASIPVTGDWNGDGRTDLGVYDVLTAAFTLRVVAADGTTTLSTVPLGSGTDLPVAGDWDGDGMTDLGVWSPHTASYTLLTGSPTSAERSAAAPPEPSALAFGRPR